MSIPALSKGVRAPTKVGIGFRRGAFRVEGSVTHRGYTAPISWPSSGSAVVSCGLFLAMLLDVFGSDLSVKAQRARLGFAYVALGQHPKP